MTEEAEATLERWKKFCVEQTGNPNRWMAEAIEFEWKLSENQLPDGSARGSWGSTRHEKQIGWWQIGADGNLVSAPMTLWKHVR